MYFGMDVIKCPYISTLKIGDERKRLISSITYVSKTSSYGLIAQMVRAHA